MNTQSQKINIPEQNQEKPKNFWQKLKIWQKVGIVFSVILIIGLNLGLYQYFIGKQLSSEKIYKLSEKENWKIFVSTGYSKTPFFLRLNGKYNAIFPKKNFIFYSSLSPNAKKVAFCESVKSGGDFEEYLTVANIDGSNRERLLKTRTDELGGVEKIIWSPVNKQEIAFLSDYNSDKESYSLYLLNIRNRFKRIIAKNLVSGLSNPSISWSPDGEKILFTSTKGKIMSVDKNGSNLRQICDKDGIALSWSPDGKTIVYKQCKSYVEEFDDGSFRYGYTGNGKYYLCDVNTKSKKIIFDKSNIFTQPTWSPNSKYLLFYKVYDLGFKSNFWIVDVESGKIVHYFKSEIKPSSILWTRIAKNNKAVKTEYQKVEEVKETVQNSIDIKDVIDSKILEKENLTHDIWDWDSGQNCYGLNEVKQCGYLDWPISYGCRIAGINNCYECLAEKNKDATICENIEAEGWARKDNCYWRLVIALNKAGMNNKIDFCDKFIGEYEESYKKECLKMAK